MLFENTSLEGVKCLTPQKFTDARGAFFRSFDGDAFLKAGIDFVPQQHSFSQNAKAFTFRGMHFQKAPYSEKKLIRCVRGAIYDILLDLRRASPTYLQSYGLELTPENGLSLFVPQGIAHGFLTLQNESDVHYLIDTPYEPSAASGVLWFDKAFDLKLPFQPQIIAAKDEEWLPYAP